MLRLFYVVFQLLKNSRILACKETCDGIRTCHTACIFNHVLNHREGEVLLSYPPWDVHSDLRENLIKDKNFD